MSKNNTIKKSDKKFIRREKARIRAQFFDIKKQEEMINNLYKTFLNKPVVESLSIVEKKPARIATQSVAGEEVRKTETKVKKVVKVKESEKKDEKKHNKA